MKEKVAKLLSGIFSPYVTILFFGLWVIAEFSSGRFILWTTLFILLIIALPLGYILLELRRGKISDIHVAIKEQRAAPFFVATLGAIILGVVCHYLGSPRQLVALATTLAVSGLIFGIISNYWKISIHAAAFTGGVLIIAMLININWLWLLLFIPIIAWARVVRKNHNALQSIVAAIVVFICVYLILRLFNL